MPRELHLCRVAWILGLTSLLLSTSSTGAQSSRVKVSGADLPLQGVRGGAVLFHISGVRAAELLEMQWGVGADTNFTVMLRVQHGPSLTWYSLQDKYGQRVSVPNMTSLRIENLTPEDSGRYWARAQLKDGTGISQGFQLTVHEPVPPPQIRIDSLSLTADWCNVTLECGTTGHSEKLSVTWESEGLPRVLGGRPPPGRAPNSWTLAVSLPLSQSNASLTCVLSNLVDQKSATTTLGEVCTPTLTPDTNGNNTILGATLGVLTVVLCAVAAGLYFWKTRGRKKDKVEMGRGPGPQDVREDQNEDIHYMQVHKQQRPERQDRGIAEHRLNEKEALTTVYTELKTPDRAMKII